MSITTDTTIRELDHRTNEVFDVRLLWDSLTNRVFIAINHQLSGDYLEFSVRPADALEAFHHPFAYAGYCDDPQLLQVESYAAAGDERSNDDQ